ncbi:transmembrane protein, putative (macronuclear) [Tetrahymena thermophila SB210]|uniref:Transmembrane protein, putative n=1 Tax=Tetrahymena thermophila (strain SB210) TaxID=312017 RepID=Q22B65_TETTS|nr:transmembrane protein, putative [Tetrahymena thermophila SB210]EAR82536.2 transmembrane protein, putative [Tetrahymena thermophila SB210]|eukprot:XP_001030199.2 transmembrane protein, putative [Tetrahymena thermophila SB210]
MIQKDQSMIPISLGQNMSFMHNNSSSNVSNQQIENENFNPLEFYSINKEGAVNRRKLFSFQNKRDNDDFQDDALFSSNVQQSSVFCDKMQFLNKDDQQQQSRSHKKSHKSSRSSTIVQTSIQTDLDKMRKEQCIQNLNASYNVDEVQENEHLQKIKQEDLSNQKPFCQNIQIENQQTKSYSNEQYDLLYAPKQQDLSQCQNQLSIQEKLNVAMKFVKQVWHRILSRDFKMTKKFHYKAISDKSSFYDKHQETKFLSNNTISSKFIKEKEKLYQSMFPKSQITCIQKTQQFIFSCLIKLNIVIINPHFCLSLYDPLNILKDIFLAIFYIVLIAYLIFYISIQYVIDQKNTQLILYLAMLSLLTIIVDFFIKMKTSVISQSEISCIPRDICSEYMSKELIQDTICIIIIILSFINEIIQPIFLLISYLVIFIKIYNRLNNNGLFIKFQIQNKMINQYVSLFITIAFVVHCSISGLNIISSISKNCKFYSTYLIEQYQNNQNCYLQIYQQNFRIIFSRFLSQSQRYSDLTNNLNDMEAIYLDIINIFDIIILLYFFIIFFNTVIKELNFKNVNQEQISDAISFLNNRKVSNQTNAICIQYLENMNKCLFQQNLKGLSVLEKFPQQLKQKIKIESYYALLNSVEQFKNNFSKSFLKQLAYFVKERVIQNDEIIQKKNVVLDKLYLFGNQNLLNYLIEYGDVQKNITELYQRERNLIYPDLKYFLSGILCPYSIQSKSNNIVPFISIEDFQTVIKNFEPDYEKYCMIKDKIQFELISFNRCNSCLQYNHDILKCQMLHFYPDKGIFYKLSDFQQRQFKNRYKYEKQNSLKIRESIRYDLMLIRLRQVTKQNNLNNTRYLFNQILTLQDSHFYKILPKVKLFKRTQKEKYLKQLMLKSNLENVFAPIEEHSPQIEQRQQAPRSTFVNVAPSSLVHQQLYEKVRISEEQNQLTPSIEGGSQNSNNIIRKSLKKESQKPIQRNSLSGQTVVGSASQFRSSQVISQQNVQNLFTQNYHGIYSNLSDNFNSQMKNEISSPTSNIMINHAEDGSQNVSQVFEMYDDEEGNKNKFINNNNIYNQNGNTDQQQQIISESPSYLTAVNGQKDNQSVFSSIDISEMMAQKSSQFDNGLNDKKQNLQRLNSKKKTYQLSVLYPMIQQSSQQSFSVLENQKQIPKKSIRSSAMFLDEENYENYEILKAFFSVLNKKKRRPSAKASSSAYQKDGNLLNLESENESMKEIKLLIQQINRGNNYSDHLFGPLEFQFDKMQQFKIYYPSYNCDKVISKLNKKIIKNQNFQRKKTLMSQRQKTQVSQKQKKNKLDQIQ